MHAPICLLYMCEHMYVDSCVHVLCVYAQMCMCVCIHVHVKHVYMHKPSLCVHKCTNKSMCTCACLGVSELVRMCIFNLSMRRNP